MTYVVPGLRSMLLGGMVLALGTVTACGSGSSGSASSSASGASTVADALATAAEQSSSNTSGTVTLSWDAPTENADGTALTDLKGYTLHYGDSPESYSDSIQIDNPGLTTYVVQNLPAGKYYFAITAYNSTGSESALSGEIATQID